MANEGNGQIGQIVQIIGPVVDVEFTNYLPPIYQALRITSEGFDVDTAVDVMSPACVSMIGRAVSDPPPCFSSKQTARSRRREWR